MHGGYGCREISGRTGVIFHSENGHCETSVSCISGRRGGQRTPVSVVGLHPETLDYRRISAGYLPGESARLSAHWCTFFRVNENWRNFAPVAHRGLLRRLYHIFSILGRGNSAMAKRTLPDPHGLYPAECAVGDNGGLGRRQTHHIKQKISNPFRNRGGFSVPGKRQRLSYCFQEHTLGAPADYTYRLPAITPPACPRLKPWASCAG